MRRAEQLTKIASTVLYRWLLSPGSWACLEALIQKKTQPTLKPSNSSQLGSGELPQPELAQRAGFPRSLPERLQLPMQPSEGSKLLLSDPIKVSFYLKETSSLVQTAGTHGPSWHFLQRGSTACLGLLKVETFLMVSPACRKFLSKPQNTHNNSPAKIFFRQQHSAIYFPPKPFHLLSGWFPASDSSVPRLCPTSLPHLQFPQVSGIVESIMTALCVCLTSRSSPKGANIRCHHNLLWSLWS